MEILVGHHEDLLFVTASFNDTKMHVAVGVWVQDVITS